MLSGLKNYFIVPVITLEYPAILAYKDFLLFKRIQNPFSKLICFNKRHTCISNLGCLTALFPSVEEDHQMVADAQTIQPQGKISIVDSYLANPMPAGRRQRLSQIFKSEKCFPGSRLIGHFPENEISQFLNCPFINRMIFIFCKEIVRLADDARFIPPYRVKSALTTFVIIFLKNKDIHFYINLAKYSLTYI